RQGRPLGDDAGFDAVVGNPPYVRQEALGPFKPYFAAAYPETYHGVADLYVYFYQQGLRQLRCGGRMSYIVTNKWLRAGYGEPLRSYFASEGAVEEIVDFGHAPIFPDADVFPCIVVLRKPKADEDGANESVRVVEFPREALDEVELDRYVEEHGHTVPRRRFGKAAWSLEPQAVDDLMEKIREKGIPLAEFTGVNPLAGIKTGLNEAFLVSTAIRNRLIQVHPSLIDHIRPYLRGRDIKRWSPSWEELWIILLRSSNGFAWPWAGYEPKQAEEVFRKTFPSLYDHMRSRKDRLQRRADQVRFWWELRSCAYYDVFDSANIFYQDLAFHSRFGIGRPKTIAEMTCFCLPTSDKWVLAVLNSPLLWAHMWRNVIHGKDEVLRLKNIYTEVLPIAPPTDEIRAEAEPAVERLISLTKSGQEARREMLDWLRTEFGVEKLGQKLEDFASLDADAFVEEVRKRRPKSEGRLTPAALRDLRSGYTEMATPAREDRAEAAKLERRLSDLVNQAYGLTPEEVDFLWSTAPPRMPRF
ncbi:MAG: Eco57I restriction-modification methylase domain-containing protein, partial [Actinomycetota bacterium]|nr:Eco57I restriction-modification methylase domain-containing protein [Actinomycetota bacterium]